MNRSARFALMCSASLLGTVSLANAQVLQYSLSGSGGGGSTARESNAVSPVLPPQSARPAFAGAPPRAAPPERGIQRPGTVESPGRRNGQVSGAPPERGPGG
jgi:hypothetical protein